ncbi:DUF2753 domain-containing protein [Alkalimarinus alittae]|uniref:DUF2753 domain-containing protein n=1 Tax=Alkalimarinus alittae TaxID=2961619 RepID=A0ABY6N3J5_9ALTE|nr:DUF2753 domain-containing protein [Alkalimarinus alittae]UZE96686.1 DUF2753 domain-containing protein [Alkalimarinus alittae]
MFNHKWKRLTTEGNKALKRRCNSDARDFYSQAITESDRLLKLFRIPLCEKVKTVDNSLAMVSMVVVSHHNLADIWARYGVRVSQTYYLEMAHQKLVDIVRDGRFPTALRSVALSELNRTYMALLSHYKTNELEHSAVLLADQYSRIRGAFNLTSDASDDVNVSSSILVH